MAELTPRERALRAQIAANERWSRPDAKDWRRGPLWTKFEKDARAADPDASDQVITERVQAMYKAHMARMALASSKVGAARRRAREREAPADDRDR
jgi:hypothetical protein